MTISTELKNRGLVEGYIAKVLLQKIYQQELELLATVAENQAAPIQAGPLNQAR